MQKWRALLGIVLYLLLLSVFLKLVSNSAVARADKHFGTTLNLVEMLPYFVSVVGYMAMRIYYFILASSVVLLVLLIFARQRRVRYLEQAALWCLALNVVVVGLSWLLA